MLTHEAKPDLTLIQTMEQMIHEIGYQLKLSPEIRARAAESVRLAWTSDGEELELQVDLDVGDEIAILIENVAASHYYSGTR